MKAPQTEGSWDDLRLRARRALAEGIGLEPQPGPMRLRGLKPQDRNLAVQPWLFYEPRDAPAVKGGMEISAQGCHQTRWAN